MTYAEAYYGSSFFFAIFLLCLRKHGLIAFDVWCPRWLADSTEEL